MVVVVWEAWALGRWWRGGRGSCSARIPGLICLAACATRNCGGE